MKKILVILGSVREGRAGKTVADWVLKKLNNRNGVRYEFIDLQEVNLPFMNEPFPPMAGEPLVHDHSKAWSETISSADGFLFITPEYNHGYSPVLKNALDYLYKEWKDKPAAFVGYGGSGAGFAIDQLRQVVEFLGMKPLEQTVGVNEIWSAVDENGSIVENYVKGDITSLLDELEKVLTRESVAV